MEATRAKASLPQLLWSAPPSLHPVHSHTGSRPEGKERWSRGGQSQKLCRPCPTHWTFLGLSSFLNEILRSLDSGILAPLKRLGVRTSLLDSEMGLGQYRKKKGWFLLTPIYNPLHVIQVMKKHKPSCSHFLVQVQDTDTRAVVSPRKPLGASCRRGWT